MCVYAAIVHVRTCVCILSSDGGSFHPSVLEPTTHSNSVSKEHYASALPSPESKIPAALSREHNAQALLT